MRHQRQRHLLGRPADQRKAVLRTLATEILKHESIETTLAKAKAVQGEVDHMISLAKRGKENLHARRQAIAFLYDLDVVRKLFNEIGPKYASRNGGYTRVVKTRLRRGDAATMAVIQLV